VNRRNESHLVPADIKNGQLINLIRRRKNRPQFGERRKITALH